MGYLTAVYTDRGIVKESNQDSICVMEAQTSAGEILMAAVCDGMGGLAKGEVASASVAGALAQWFTQELPSLITGGDFWQDLKRRWYQLLLDENQKIGRYGKGQNLSLGTTVSALLLADYERYLVAHVGDSRIYCMNDREIKQITEDQTVTASEVRAGRLTPEQAEEDPRRSVLLQCVGASERIQPVIMEGRFFRNQAFLLCSDGFRRQISSEEIHNLLRPGAAETEEEMKNNLIRLTELNKERQENDNISSILIKVV